MVELTDSLGNGELSELLVVKSLLNLGDGSGGLVLGKSSSENSGLLHSQVLGEVLLLTVLRSGSGDSLLGEDGQNLSDGFSHLL